MGLIKHVQHGSLFSGIGGFDLAADWTGWNNAFHCEISEFCNTILKHYWPDATSINNIVDYDWKKWKGKIDVLSGGFPCQPYSVAGKRRGKDDPRHLWPEMLRAIREISPRWVVAENVRGLISWNGGMVFDEVQADLEAAGYEVLPFLLPAAGVNAPHRRERIWIIACKSVERSGNKSIPAANADNRTEQEQPTCSTEAGNHLSAARNDTGTGAGSGNIGGNITQGIRQLATSPRDLQKMAADSYRCKRCQGGVYTSQSKTAEGNACTCHARFIWNAWEKFPTQSALCHGDDGLSPQLGGITFSKWRSESIKAGGNAIVPQVAHQIFKAINEFL